MKPLLLLICILLPLATFASEEDPGIHPIRTIKAHDGVVASLAFSPDAKYILSGGADKTMKLWEAATGKLVRTFEGHTGMITSVACSPDGKYALSGSWDRTVRLGDIQTGKETAVFLGHESMVNTVAFSPNGKYALSGSSDNMLKLWEVQTGKEVRTLKGHTGPVTSAAFSPDGKHIASAGHDTWDRSKVRIWEVETGMNIFSRELPNSPIPLSLAFLPDSRHVYFTTSGRSTALLDIDNKEMREIGKHSKAVYTVAVSPSGKLGLSGDVTGMLKLYEFEYGTLRTKFLTDRNEIWSVAYSPDGQNVISGGKDGTISLWQALE
jgi:WD40 repeat protein